MKQELLEKALKLGFKSDIIGNTVNAKFSSKNFYYLWLCELQKWLREVHNIHICVDIDIEDNWYFNIYDLNSKRNAEFDLKLENNKYKSYEEALEIGLFTTLKLFKDGSKNI